MEMRTFAKTGEKISLLGFGCMRFPVVDGKVEEIDKERAQEMIDYAFERGVNYFDTAYPYHNGASERFIGEALSRRPRDSFKLATKLPPWLVGTEADADRIFEEQLARCRVEYFDYYLIHNVSEAKLAGIRKFKMIERLNEKKRQGLIRNIGFSFHAPAAFMNTMLAENDWDFAQIQLNYLDWEVQDAKELYAILSERNLPVVVMEPVRGGALARLSQSSAAILKEANPNASTASWAIRFAASPPNVLTVLSGMSDLEQVRDNVRTMENFTPVSPAEQEVITKALTAYRKDGAVPCTACGYCMDCPTGVDIPKTFALYNEYRSTKADNAFLLHLKIIGEAKQPKNCVQCGECASKCPQGIDIPEQMREIAQVAADLSKGELPPWL